MSASENKWLARTSDILVDQVTEFTNENLSSVLSQLAHDSGGTTLSKIIQRQVIIINPSLNTGEEITGKLYKYFSGHDSAGDDTPTAAKYMAAAQGQTPVYFEVQLPAGEFSEDITLQSYYTIKGNNTELTGIIRSAITWTYSDFTVAITGGPRYISDCRVTGQLRLNNDNTHRLFTFSHCEFGADIGREETGTFTSDDALLLLDCKTLKGQDITDEQTQVTTEKPYSGNYILFAVNCMVTGKWRPTYGIYHNCTFMNFTATNPENTMSTPDTFSHCTFMSTTEHCKICSEAVMSDCVTDSSNSRLILGETVASGGYNHTITARNCSFHLQHIYNYTVDAYSSTFTMETKAAAYDIGIDGSPQIYLNSHSAFLFDPERNPSTEAYYHLTGTGGYIHAMDPTCVAYEVPDDTLTADVLGNTVYHAYKYALVLKSAESVTWATQYPWTITVVGMSDDIDDNTKPWLGIAYRNGGDLSDTQTGWANYHWFNRFYGGGSGGLSTNIIVIDPEGTEDEGKIYTSYASAYTYMTTGENNTKRFAVYLPPCKAADSTTAIGAITLNDNITVIGNNTELSVSITSLCTQDKYPGSSATGYIKGCKLIGCPITLGTSSDAVARTFTAVDCEVKLTGAITRYVSSRPVQVTFDRCSVQLSGSAYTLSTDTNFINCDIYPDVSAGIGYLNLNTKVETIISQSTFVLGTFHLSSDGGTSNSNCGKLYIRDCTVGTTVYIEGTGVVAFQNCSANSRYNSDVDYIVNAGTYARHYFQDMNGGFIRVATGASTWILNSVMNLSGTSPDSYTGTIYVSGCNLGGNSAFKGNVEYVAGDNWVDASAETAGTVVRKDKVKVVFSESDGQTFSDSDSPARNTIGFASVDGRDLTSPSSYTWVAAPNTLTTTAELAATGWSSNTQTVSVSGVTTANTIIVSPAPAHFSVYDAAGIICTGQGSGTLTFTCTTAPSTDITVNVVIIAV